MSKKRTTGSKRTEAGKQIARPRVATSAGAFDTWLQRELRDRFDAVAREPIPDDLLKLLRAPKRRR